MIWSIAGSVARRFGLAAVRRFLTGAGPSILRGALRAVGQGSASQHRLSRILNILDKVMRKTERTTIMSHILRNTHAGDLLELVIDVLWAIAQEFPEEAVADTNLRELLRDDTLRALSQLGTIRTDCLSVSAIEHYIKTINNLIKQLDRATLLDEESAKISAAKAYYQPNFFQGSSPPVQMLSQIITQAALEAGFADFKDDRDRLESLVASSTKALIAREYFPVLFNVAVLLGLTAMAGQLACALASKQVQVTGIVSLPCLKITLPSSKPRLDIQSLQNNISAGVVRITSKQYGSKED